jgi:hypothetical protein
VGLERGPLSLVSTTEELHGRNSSGSGLEIQEYGRRGSAAHIYIWMTSVCVYRYVTRLLLHLQSQWADIRDILNSRTFVPEEEDLLGPSQFCEGTDLTGPTISPP